MHRPTDIAVFLIVLAGAYVITRKGSHAANIIHALSGGFASNIRAATGQK